MPSLNTKVYPLVKSATKSLKADTNSYIDFGSLELTDFVNFSDISGVSGTILDDNSNGINEAYVILKVDGSDTNPMYVTKTDANGKFKLSVPQAANYSLTIIANGYESYIKKTIDVNTSTITMPNITLISDSELTESTKAILGTVIDNTDNKLVANAFVSLYNGKTRVGVTVTNDSGQFAFIGLDGAIDTYKIIVSNLSHEIYESNAITMASSKFTKLDEIKLNKLVVDNSSLVQGSTTNNSTVILYKQGELDVPVAYTKSNNSGYYSFIIPSGTAADYYVEITNNTNA